MARSDWNAQKGMNADDPKSESWIGCMISNEPAKWNQLLRLYLSALTFLNATVLFVIKERGFKCSKLCQFL